MPFYWYVEWICLATTRDNLGTSTNSFSILPNHFLICEIVRIYIYGYLMRTMPRDLCPVTLAITRMNFPKLLLWRVSTGAGIQYTSGRVKPLASVPPVVHVNTAAMADSPDARSLLSASSHLNLMEVDTVRNCSALCGRCRATTIHCHFGHVRMRSILLSSNLWCDSLQRDDDTAQPLPRYGPLPIYIFRHAWF